MDYLNFKEFEYNNIIKWHEKGYTGKGIKIANLEAGNPEAWNLKGKVIDPFQIERKTLSNHHGNNVMDVLLQVAPDSTIYSLPTGGNYVDGKCEGSFVEKTLPYIEDNNIHLANASLYGVESNCVKERIEKVKEKGTVFITGSGNTGDRGVLGYNSTNGWITVGAVHLNKKGEIYLANYSSVGKEVDFVQFSKLNVHSVTDPAYTILVMGTSYSSPMLCGMLALVQQFFLEKAGRTLYQDEIYQFILDNTIDLGQAGKDINFGHGLFILPDPENIRIGDYVKEPIEKEDIMDKYVDVNKDSWYYPAVKHMIKTGQMEGEKDNEGNFYFKPNEPLTRAQYAQIKYRQDKGI